jgi:hypothetical protein
VRLAILLLSVASPVWAACPAQDPDAIARVISQGHAFAKHARDYRPGRVIAGGEFLSPAIRTPDQFASLIAREIAHPDAVRPLARGRRAYWEEDFGGVVIVDPNNDQCGTAFRPARGKAYFDDLR